jgi:hypothetical protein
MHWSHIKCCMSDLCNLMVRYTSHFVPSRSDVPFSFYNLFCDQVCCCLVAFSMELVMEQRICVKFRFKVGITAVETHNMLREAYSDDVSSQMTT